MMRLYLGFTPVVLAVVAAISPSEAVAQQRICNSTSCQFAAAPQAEAPVVSYGVPVNSVHYDTVTYGAATNPVHHVTVSNPVHYVTVSNPVETVRHTTRCVWDNQPSSMTPVGSCAPVGFTPNFTELAHNGVSMSPAMCYSQAGCVSSRAVVLTGANYTPTAYGYWTPPAVNVNSNRSDPASTWTTAPVQLQCTGGPNGTCNLNQ